MIAIPDDGDEDFKKRLGIAFDTALGARFEELSKFKNDNEVFRMSLNVDQVEKADGHAIDRWFEILHPFCDIMHCMVPSTSQLQLMFKSRDQHWRRKLSKMSSAASVDAWAHYEATKMHELLALTNKYCSRPGNARGARLRILKDMWRKHKPHLMERDRSGALADPKKRLELLDDYPGVDLGLPVDDEMDKQLALMGLGHKVPEVADKPATTAVEICAISDSDDNDDENVTESEHDMCETNIIEQLGQTSFFKALDDLPDYPESDNEAELIDSSSEAAGEIPASKKACVVTRVSDVDTALVAEVGDGPSATKLPDFVTATLSFIDAKKDNEPVAAKAQHRRRLRGKATPASTIAQKSKEGLTRTLQEHAKKKPSSKRARVADEPPPTHGVNVRVRRNEERTRGRIVYRVVDLRNRALVCVCTSLFPSEDAAEAFAQFCATVARTGVSDKSVFAKAKKDVCTSGAASVGSLRFSLTA